MKDDYDGLCRWDKRFLRKTKPAPTSVAAGFSCLLEYLTAVASAAGHVGPQVSPVFTPVLAIALELPTSFP